MRFQLMAPSKSGQKDSGVNHLDVNHALADGVGHCSAKDKRGDEVPEGRPRHGAEGRKHSRRNDRRDRIRGIMPAIREFEGQCQKHRNKSKRETVHGIRRSLK